MSPDYRSEPIDRGALQAARLRLGRRIASLLLTALADSGMDVADAMARIGRSRRYFWDNVRGLSEGRTNSLDVISDLFFAFGTYLEIRIKGTSPPCSPAVSEVQPDTGDNPTERGKPSARS